VCEAKLWVSSDWSISLYKLQPSLELYRFAQALLKTKAIRWKAHLILRVAKGPLCNIHQNGWRITRGTQPESRMLHLESRSYHKSYSSPKAYCFLRIVDKKPSLVVSSRCLTPLNSACISFTLNQVHSLVHFYHRAIPW
jgi:hypothetical protein